jgi:hypothetical protein
MTKNKDVAPSGRVALGLLGLVQIAFAFLAFWDLRLRRDNEINGPKWVWVPAILVNWIGPANYFVFGIKR